jgi:hypothetical protein
MSIRNLRFRNVVCRILAAALVVQPVFATEYRIPLKNPKPTPVVPGAGDGDVAVDEEPVQLQLSVDALEFEVGPDMAPSTQKVLLANTGFRKATLSPIQGNADFSVSHNCPTALDPGSSCTLSITPTTTQLNVRYRLTAAAAELTEPVSAQLTTVEPNVGPRLRVSDSPVFLGDLAPGRQGSATATLTNTGTADATLSGTESKNGFTVTSTCPAQLPAKASCTITASFASWVPNTYSTTLTLAATENAGKGTVPLTFFAKVYDDPSIAPLLELNPASLVFDPVVSGATATKSTVLTNHGTAPAVLGKILSSTDFSITHDCPEMLGIGAACNIQVVFIGRAAGTSPMHSMKITAQSKASAELLLQGTVVSAAPVPSIDPSVLNFGNVHVRQSVSQTATLSNTTTKAIPLKSITVDAGEDVFKLSNNCGDSLAAKSSCTVSVTFAPLAPAARNGRVRVYTGAASVSIPLQGMGHDAVLRANPSSVRIGAVAWPSGTLTRAVTLFNEGNIDATGLSLANTDPRVAVNAGDCTETLAARKSCSLTLLFTPSGPGAFSSTLNIASQSGNTLSVPISGAALLLTSSPASLAFDATKVGMSAPDQAVMLTNNGPDAVPFDGISVVLGDFAQANNCGVSLAAGNSCLVAVRFSPKVDGPAAGALSVATYGTGYLNIPLTGTGLPTWLAFSPAAVPFPRTYVKEPSTPVDVAISNPTPDAVSITGMSVSQGAAYFGQSNNCGTTLASGQSCVVTLQMTPPDATGYRGTFSVVSSIGTYNLTLTGSGENARPELSVTSFAFGTVALGERVTQKATVTNPATRPMAIKPVATKLDGFEMESDCGTSIPGRGACTVSVTFVPTRPGSYAVELAIETVAGESANLRLSGSGEGAALSFTPSNVQFGNVLFPGATSVRNVTVINTGNVTLTGLSFAPTDPALSIDASQCTGSLKASESCVVTLQYAPTAAGPFSTGMQVASDNAGSPVVTGSGRAVPLTVSPSALTFPATWVGESAADQSVTVTNQDTVALALNGVSVTTGQSSYNQSNNCGASLAAGASCTISVRFTPGGSGPRTGTITAAAFGSTLFTVPLSGSAKSPSLSLSTTSVSFEPTAVGTASPMMDITVSNPTGQTATISGASIVTNPAEFAQSNDCGTSLAAGASCTVTLQMTPTTTKGSKGSWAIASPWGNYPVTLSGQGVEPEEVPPLNGEDGFTHYAVNFLATEYGQVSAVRNVKFSNKGTAPLTIQSIAFLEGTDDFRESNNCTSVLRPGEYCTFTLRFTPTQSGKRTGGIALLTDTGNHYFDLGGIGTAAQGTLTAITSSDFGPVDAGSSAQRSFTFKNTGDAPARNLAATVKGTDLSFVTNTCGTSSALATVAPGATCNITVKYAPAAPGPLSDAVLSVAGTVVNGPVTMALTGSAPVPGLVFDASPSPDYGVISPNTLTTRTFVLRNVGSTTDVLLAAPVVTGAEFSRTSGGCVAGTSLAANGTCVVTVTTKPATEGTFTGTITATSKKGAGASLNLTATVQAKTPTIRTWTVPTRVYGTAPFTLTAPSSDSSGSFVYTIDNPNVATVSGATVTITGVGSATVTATQQAHGVYRSAATTATLTVTKANPVITFTIPTQTYSLDPIRIAPVTLQATSSSTGALSYASNNPAKVAISGNVATISATGSYVVTVTQEATDKYNAATKTADLAVTGPGGSLILAGRVWSPMPSNSMSWDVANNGCLSKTLGGYSGWRLATKDELLALANVDKTVRPVWPYMWASGGTPTARTAVYVYGATFGTFGGGQSSVNQTCTRD